MNNTNIMGRTRNINDIFNSSGSFAGTTMGTEILNTTDMTLGFTEDYVYLSDSPKGHLISRDILRAMLLGETFQHETGAYDGDGNKLYSTIKVAGTNGTIKRDTKAVSNRFFGGLFIEDGKLVVPQATDKHGNPLLKANARVSAYNTTALTVMVEFLYSFSQEKNNGFRFVYTLNGGVTYNEADDANKVSCTAQILCDPRAISSFWIDGSAPRSLMMSSIKNEDTGELLGIADVMTLVKNKKEAEEWNDDNPIVVYVNNDSTDTKSSGYILFTGEGIPVPAYISEDGANPVLVDPTATEEPEALNADNNKITDYIYDIYDFDMLKAKFVQYYMPALEGYYVSQMSLPKTAVQSDEPAVHTDTATYTTRNRKATTEDAEPMSGFRIRKR